MARQQPALGDLTHATAPSREISNAIKVGSVRCMHCGGSGKQRQQHQDCQLRRAMLVRISLTATKESRAPNCGSCQFSFSWQRRPLKSFMQPCHAVCHVRTRQPLRVVLACWAQLRRWQPAQLVQWARLVQLGLCWGQKRVVLSAPSAWLDKNLPRQSLHFARNQTSSCLSHYTQRSTWQMIRVRG